MQAANPSRIVTASDSFPVKKNQSSKQLRIVETIKATSFATFIIIPITYSHPLSIAYIRFM
jgi:hypothetical protein